MHQSRCQRVATALPPSRHQRKLKFPINPQPLLTIKITRESTSTANIIYLCHMTIKEQTYQEALNGIKGVMEGETDIIANLANSVAILKEAFNFWWIGYYLVKNSQLVLGPFQGPVACTRIDLGKGVCGTSWQQKQTIIVPDVHQFPGHIACSAASNSEIVVPVIQNGEVIMVLDVDSIHYNEFDEIDKKYLEEITVMIANKF